MRYLLYLSLILTLFFSSCKQDKTKSSSTFVGGEIVNSNEDFITLEKDGEFIDSIPLDENGKFSYEFDDEKFKSGLYTFRHAPEGQVFYIEKNDSLLLRVNTKEFDESIMYTGNKAKENNFLMEMYLLNEKDNDVILSYYKVSPEKFAQKTDSIKKSRKKDLLKLQENNNFSKPFLLLANETIDYEYYDLRERYAYLINKYFNEFRNKIPKEFFSYRKEVNFNNKELQSYYVYQRFLDNYLKNKAIDRCVSKQKNTSNCFNTESVQNLKNRLIIADSIFKIKNLRNKFIGSFARKQINNSRNDQQIDSSLQLLKSFNFPDKKFEELKKLGEIQKNYFEGNDVSKARLISTEHENILLKDILNKPTITFTWSIYASSNHTRQHDRINELRNRYPEFNFLGVNIDSEESYNLWIKSLDNFDYDKDFEVKIRARGQDIDVYKNFINKILLINRKGIITKANLNIYDPNFEVYLLEYLN
ncbi:hypothetical protein [Mesonia aestuariivivens]|uniref:Thioredoxin domain-containing protein n=1 Tax=Mesonia aestuariivivens TaxID=2796128 RepID=A0ABS6W2G0_9FLAO|nr:hypothetical protein [Mesonia aestuariivivens]MBW2961319.1 hypothetical protein [Mesonia aestuariivivens]